VERRKIKRILELQLKGNRLQNDKCKVCCAPDDVSHPEDVLDDDVEEILKDWKQWRVIYESCKN